MSPIRDVNQIAFSILHQVTLTTKKRGETAGQRANRAGAIAGGKARAANLTHEQIVEIGKRSAAKFRQR